MGYTIVSGNKLSAVVAYTKYQILRMLAPPVSEIGKLFGTLLCFTLQPHVKILPIDPYFSFDILKI